MIELALQIRQLLVESPSHLRMAELAEREWTALPVESAGHFDEDDIRRLSEALALAGVTSLLAVAVEELQKEPLFLELPATSEGLESFNRSCGLFAYLLTTQEVDVAILCTVEDYYLVAGEQSFVSRACGGLEPARARFHQFASSADWPETIRGRLLEVARRYGQVPPGRCQPES